MVASPIYVVFKSSSSFYQEGPEGGGGGGVRIPVPSIEITQNPSPNMKKGKIPSLEAVVP